MEKAAILIGGVALLVYVTSDSGNSGNGDNGKKPPPPPPPSLPPPLRVIPPLHVLPPPIHSESPGLEHLHAPNRRLLPFYSDPLKMHAPPRHVLPPPIHGEEPGLQHLQAPRRRLLPFESAPIREHAPPRHVLPPPIHGESPGLQHLQAPRRRLLPPPQPADPLKLVPLAPLKLQHPPPPKIGGYSPCQLVVAGKNQGMTAYYNLPQFTTQATCEAAYVPCPPQAAACQIRWSPR